MAPLHRRIAYARRLFAEAYPAGELLFAAAVAILDRARHGMPQAPSSNPSARHIEHTRRQWVNDVLGCGYLLPSEVTVAETTARHAAGRRRKHRDELE
ncbi:hypothetical protein, partial [Frankia sp. Cr1]|uniref:hypothetical protein n=1 Tax=Frankia sp. Cr1 TaxID=3073931 RepID=UPI002AD2A35F